MPRKMSPAEGKEQIRRLYEAPCFLCEGETYDLIIVRFEKPLVEDGRRVIRWGYANVSLCFDCYNRFNSGELFEELEAKLSTYCENVDWGGSNE